MDITNRKITRRNLILLGTGGVAAGMAGNQLFGAAETDDIEGVGTVINGKVASVTAVGLVLALESGTREIVFTPQTECLFGPSASVLDLEVGDYIGIQGTELADGRFEARRISPIFRIGEATIDALEPNAVQLNGARTRLLRRGQSRLKGSGRNPRRGERVVFAVTRRGDDGRFEVGGLSEKP
jgi:Domain of unknown function (DUF5666)